MRKIGIVIILVLCLTLLLLTGCVLNAVIPETANVNLENQENTEEPVIIDTEEPVIKWSGLGMVLLALNEDTAIYDSRVDILLANGFTEIRECPNYTQNWCVRSKAAIIRNVGKGVKYVWGVSYDSTITAANWPDYRQAILNAAQWAQDNGVYEFQLGNEEEHFVDGTTMTVDQIITNFKDVATEVKQIFTNGKISYTCIEYAIPDWIAAGKGDIDILASNIYMQWGEACNPNDWKGQIDALVNAFGADGTCITEFCLNSVSLDTYSTDEAVQAATITEMIEYIMASGIARAFYFLWYHPDLQMGVVKDDGTYRLLWNQALLNSRSVEFANVPTKTTTASLPNTIALLQK